MRDLRPSILCKFLKYGSNLFLFFKYLWKFVICSEGESSSCDHLPRNASSCSLSSSVSSVDHSNQPENCIEPYPVSSSRLAARKRVPSSGAKRGKVPRHLCDTNSMYSANQSDCDPSKLATIAEAKKGSNAGSSDIVAMGQLFARLAKKPNLSGEYGSPKLQRRKTPFRTSPFRPTSSSTGTDGKSPGSRTKAKRTNSEYSK